MERIKEILIKTIPIVIFGTQTSLCFSEVREYFGLNEAEKLIPVVIGLVILFLLNHWLLLLKPYSKFKKFVSAKDLIIGKQVEDFIKTFDLSLIHI